MRVIPDHIWAALTIWMEGRGEPWDGQLGVAEVIRNRTTQHFFSDGSVPSTVLWPFQFSCWNTKDPNRIKAAQLHFEDKLFSQCLRAWNHAMEHETHYTKGALYYLNPDVLPKLPEWVNECIPTVKIGRHQFYRRKYDSEAKGTMGT